MHIVVLCGIALIRQKKCMSILTQPEGFITGMAAKMFTVAQRLRGPGGERRSKGAGEVLTKAKRSKADFATTRPEPQFAVCCKMRYFVGGV